MTLCLGLSREGGVRKVCNIGTKPKMQNLGLDGVQVGLGSQMTDLTRKEWIGIARTRPAVGEHNRPHVPTNHERGEAAEPALQPNHANGSESFRERKRRDESASCVKREGGEPWTGGGQVPEGEPGSPPTFPGCFGGIPG